MKLSDFSLFGSGFAFGCALHHYMFFGLDGWIAGYTASGALNLLCWYAKTAIAKPV